MASCSKRKRVVLTVDQKLEVLKRLETGESGTSLALSYNVGKATITGIKSQKHAPLNFASQLDDEGGLKKRKVMKTAQDTKLDKAVYMWFIQERNRGQPISGPLLCEKALDMNSMLGGPSDFKASTGWLKHFKSRHGIGELNIQGTASVIIISNV